MKTKNQKEELRGIFSFRCSGNKKLFEEHNVFCTKGYYAFGLLGQGEKFTKDPDVYYAVYCGNNLIATLGIFIKRKENLLPLEEVFNYSAPIESIEIGRLYIEKGIGNLKLKAAKLLFKGLSEFYFKELIDKEILMETFELIISFFAGIIDKNLFIPQKGEILLNNIPKKSQNFYKSLSPKVYKVNKIVLEEQFYKNTKIIKRVA